ncbi:hypothetical protein C8R43DRAFT_1151986 [Mycena crocata]|nr:hypothetical protein C8R43DRAFT_1151986 [Mycena crocata]
MCDYVLGNYKETISYCKEALSVLQLSGVAGGRLEAGVMNTLAGTHALKSEFAEARQIQSQLLNKNPLEQDPTIHCLALLNIVNIHVQTDGQKQAIEKKILTASTVFNKLNNHRALMHCELLRAQLNLREGDNSFATESRFRECFQVAWGQMDDIVTGTLETLGDTNRWGHNVRASTWTIVLLAHAFITKQKLGIYKAFQFMGDIFKAYNDHDETAIHLYSVALDGFTKMDVHLSRAQCFLQLGDISKRRRDDLKAIELWKSARPLFERALQAKDIARIDYQLAGISPKTQDE